MLQNVFEVDVSYKPSIPCAQYPFGGFTCLTEASQLLGDTYALVPQLTVSVPYVTGGPPDNATVNVLTDRAAIIAWAAKVSREFTDSLKRKSREPTIIMAHWAILLGRFQHVWWLDGLGANMVTAIAIIIGKDNWHL